MKKTLIVFLLVFCCGIFAACEVSNSELANSLEGNLTRLVYSVGYLDSASSESLSTLSSMGGGSLSNSGTNNVKNNSGIENNSVSENNRNITDSGNNNLTGNNSQINTNSVSATNNGDVIPNNGKLLNNSTIANNKFGNGDATSTVLGGLSNDNTAVVNTDGNGVTIFGVRSNKTDSANNATNTSTLFNNTNNSDNNVQSENQSRNNQINNNNTNVIDNTTSNGGIMLADVTLIMQNQENLTSLLRSISEKRGIIMLYCNDLRTGNITLTSQEKAAVNEYITVVREITNYINTNTGTLTKHLNNINGIEDMENSTALINAKIVRVNDVLNTRYAKLNTAINALDGIKEILTTRSTVDYSSVINNSSLNNTAVQEPQAQDSKITIIENTPNNNSTSNNLPNNNSPNNNSQSNNNTNRMTIIGEIISSPQNSENLTPSSNNNQPIANNTTVVNNNTDPGASAENTTYINNNTNNPNQSNLPSSQNQYQIPIQSSSSQLSNQSSTTNREYQNQTNNQYTSSSSIPYNNINPLANGSATINNTYSGNTPYSTGTNYNNMTGTEYGNEVRNVIAPNQIKNDSLILENNSIVPTLNETNLAPNGGLKNVSTFEGNLEIIPAKTLNIKHNNATVNNNKTVSSMDNLLAFPKDKAPRVQLM